MLTVHDPHDDIVGFGPAHLLLPPTEPIDIVLSPDGAH